MGFRGKLCLVVFALILASAVFAFGQVQDPELEQCMHQCRSQREASQEKKSLCQQRCERYAREKQRREHGGGSRREEEYGGERERWGEETYGGRERTEEGQEQNPYVFEDRHFFTGFQTQHGRVRILQKFTDRSRLLRGIENFRIAISESEPQTFTVPSHWDTDIVLFVARGRGTLSLVHQDRRESFNIRQGDIVRIQAGTTAYLINRDNNERLHIVKLLRPVNTPGEFEAFFGAGGENPQSFFRTFSDEILEAAFNVGKERLQRLFGQQRQGVIIKASDEQIRAMGHHEEGGIWPFGGESKGTFNIYQQRPVQSNQYGQLFVVDSSHFRQIRDLDLAVSLVNISQGAMTAPHYNSKATKIAVVVDGEGYFEMACPHLSQTQGGRQRMRGREEEMRGGEQQQREVSGGPRYEKVSSRLRHGTVVVVPAGHPFVAVASNNQNLQLLCFEVNAFNNEKFTLAGRRNVINQLEREAKALAFGIPAREVEEVFRSQQEEFFFPGPRQQRRQGRQGEGWSDE